MTHGNPSRVRQVQLACLTDLGVPELSILASPQGLLPGALKPLEHFRCLQCQWYCGRVVRAQRPPQTHVTKLAWKKGTNPRGRSAHREPALQRGILQNASRRLRFSRSQKAVYPVRKIWGQTRALKNTAHCMTHACRHHSIQFRIHTTTGQLA